MSESPKMLFKLDTTSLQQFGFINVILLLYIGVLSVLGLKYAWEQLGLE